MDSDENDLIATLIRYFRQVNNQLDQAGLRDADLARAAVVSPQKIGSLRNWQQVGHQRELLQVMEAVHRHRRREFTPESADVWIRHYRDARKALDRITSAGWQKELRWLAGPDKLPLVVDANAHLWEMESRLQRDQERPDVGVHEITAVIERARFAGVGAILAAGCSGVRSWTRSIAIAEHHPGVYASIALHPQHGDQELEFLAEFAAHPRVVAIGDAQLRYYEIHGDTFQFGPVIVSGYDRIRKTQCKLMESHIGIASDLGLPVIVELTDMGSTHAVEDLLGLHATAGRPGLDIILQHVPPQEGLVDELLSAGVTFMLVGNVTYIKDPTLVRRIKRIPLDRILLGTDSPYYAPSPLRGRENEPANLQIIVEALERMFERPRDEIAQRTTATARRLFQLDSPPRLGIVRRPRQSDLPDYGG